MGQVDSHIGLFVPSGTRNGHVAKGSLQENNFENE